MREILFRGKRIENGEWAMGYIGVFKGITQIYVPFTAEEEKENEGHIFSAIGGVWHTVDPETVGQFTGLTDKNGKKIFDVDIIRSDNGKQSAVSVVKFGEYVPKMFYKMLDMFCPGKKHLPTIGFYAESVDKHEEIILFQSPCVTVIGNIHDNPELLEPPKGD